MINLINRYFVPVYVSNEDFLPGGRAPAAERAEKERIYRDALAAKLSTGTVHVYIVAPDGHPIDTQHVATAARVEPLTEMLERTIEKLKVSEGRTLVQPAPQSAAPVCDPGSVVLHVTARYLLKKGGDFVPLDAKLGETRSAGWAAYASEDWLVLDADEQAKWLASAKPQPGSAWDLDAAVTAKLLNHFYPQTENNAIATNRIDEQSARATILSIENGVVRARVEGRLKMKHPFYHKDDDNFVHARFVGLIEFEPASKRLRSLRLVTDRATYGASQHTQHFGVAVRSR